MTTEDGYADYPEPLCAGCSQQVQAEDDCWECLACNNLFCGRCTNEGREILMCFRCLRKQERGDET